MPGAEPTRAADLTGYELWPYTDGDPSGEYPATELGCTRCARPIFDLAQTRPTLQQLVDLALEHEAVAHG